MAEQLKLCPTCKIPMLGVEIPGIYDGVLYWKCETCSYECARFPEGHYLRERYEAYLRGEIKTPWLDPTSE